MNDGSTPLKRTPLYDTHVRSGARMIDFGGWSMPVQYDGILAEHLRTRTDATIFDTCHMGRFLVTGKGALEALSGILTADLKSQKDGQCRYGFLLREDGGILDDVIAYRVHAEKWMIVVNAGTRDKDRAWLTAHLPAEVRFEDASDRLAKLDVQGPKALERVQAALGVDFSALGYFRFTTASFQGAELTVSRTGYTGEKGVELYLPAGRVVALWEALVKAGVTPAGLGARDTLRLEAGLPLYGHEISEAVTPAEAGMERYCAKPDAFIGQAAVRRILAEGPRVRLCGFRMSGRQTARAGNAVQAGGADIGRVTSGSFSPILQAAIGFAYLERAWAEPGRRVTADTGRARLDAEVVRTPFYKAV